jgi:hypothetical protein
MATDLPTQGEGATQDLRNAASDAAAAGAAAGRPDPQARPEGPAHQAPGTLSRSVLGQWLGKVVLGEAWSGGRGLGRRMAMRLLAVLIVLMVAFAVAPVANSLIGYQNKDYTLWYETGRVLLGGGEVYPKDDHLFPFMYPPSCAVMLALGSALGEREMVVVLVVLNGAAWLASILLAVYLATGKVSGQNPLLYVVPTLAVIPFVHDTYLLGQPNLLLLALMLGGFACLRRRWPWGAGTLIGLAAAIKAFPIMALCYLVYRRCWKAALAMTLTVATLLLVAPLPFRGPRNTWDDLKTWTQGMVLKYDSYQIAQRPERCYSFKNHSMIALANRLLRSVPADGESKDGWQVNVADLDFKTVNALIVAAGLGLCLFYVAAMPRADRRTARTDAIEQCMLLLLILMFSPLSFNYFYVWLIYPLALALHLAQAAPRGSRRRVVLAGTFATPLVLLFLTIPFLRVAQAYGNLFFSCLVLLVGLAWEMRSGTKTVPQQSGGPPHVGPRRLAQAAHGLPADRL